MKILFVSRLYLPHLGGVEVHLKEIAAVLVRLGHEVIIVTLQHDEKLKLEDEYDGVTVFRIPIQTSKNKQKTWNAIREYSQLFVEADVVHVHDVFWWILPFYLKIKKKVYITFHGWETKLPVPTNSKIHRFIASRLSCGVIHVGEYIQKFYWDRPDFVIYGGINPKRFIESNTREHIRKSTKQLKFVFIGRLEEDTDLPLYLKFLKELQTRKIHFEVTWVGDGSFKNECEEFGIVTGFIKNINQYIISADFVFSSSYLSILESLYLEKIVLSFYSNPLKKVYLETFPGARYMLISRTVSGMILKLDHLLSSHNLQQKTQQDARQFALGFSWETVVNDYLKLWKNNRND